MTAFFVTIASYASKGLNFWCSAVSLSEFPKSQLDLSPHLQKKIRLWILKGSMFMFIHFPSSYVCFLKSTVLSSTTPLHIPHHLHSHRSRWSRVLASTRSHLWTWGKSTDKWSSFGKLWKTASIHNKLATYEAGLLSHPLEMNYWNWSTMDQAQMNLHFSLLVMLLLASDKTQ